MTTTDARLTRIISTKVATSSIRLSTALVKMLMVISYRFSRVYFAKYSVALCLIMLLGLLIIGAFKLFLA